MTDITDALGVKENQLTTLSDVGDKSVDIFRDTYVRYLGYSNEIGEAFRAQIGTRWVQASYGVAIAYVLADTSHKTWLAHKNHVVEDFTKSSRAKKSIIAASDTLTWQMLASVAIPGFTINRVCALSNYLLKRASKMDSRTRKWLVTAIGLTTIPFIITPTDNMVDHAMDRTFRKWFE